MRAFLSASLYQQGWKEDLLQMHKSRARGSLSLMVWNMQYLQRRDAETSRWSLVSSLPEMWKICSHY